MSGLIAIVAHERDRRIPGQMVEDLVTAYDTLRPGGTRHKAAAGDFAQVVKFDTATSDRQGILVDGTSWAVITGTAYGAMILPNVQPEALDGQFVLVAYDAYTDCVRVAADPLGMCSVFVAERAGLTYVATSALALAKHLRARPNDLALHLFLRTGSQFGTLTSWEGIKRLDPGTVIEFTPAGRTVRTYWRPSIDPTITRLSLADTVERCIEVALATFHSLLAKRPRSWADLTGGYDSRLLTLLLRDAGVDFDTNTSGENGDPDVRIAAQVARLLGCTWKQIELPGNWDQLLPGMLSTALAWSDGQLDVLYLAEVLWKHAQKSQIHPTLLVGGGGEHFRNFAWQQEFLRAGKSTNVNLDHWIDMRVLRPLDTRILVDDYSSKMRTNVRERMAARVLPYKGELNTTQLDILYAYKTTGHFGAYLSAAGAFLRAELPFYFKPVFETVFSTNYRYRNNHRLLRHMINRLDPGIAAIETTTGGPAQPLGIMNLPRFAPYFVQIGRDATTKISHKLTGYSLFAPTAHASEHAATVRRTVLQHLQLAPATMHSAWLYKPGELVDFLERDCKTTFGAANLFGRVITVELVLRSVDGA